ncbi:MAG TPA: xanthine dehydrogenase family protein subunit M [Candidatus Binataceae bacterium]|nr:xanthine dehydrogenase family protein subunit M [Candidatus Binataceae bacterium]
MNRFEILTPSDLPHAGQLLAGRNHAALAGGVDLIDLLKQNILAPSSLVNLKGLRGMDVIEPDGHGGIRIGALVKLREVAGNPLLRERYAALADAAAQAATPQVRNLATVGGNLLQRPRCWYFRNPDVHCLKKGGGRCYALGGLNRYHAILGGGPSFIVHPSNLAPALVVFGASVKLVGPAGERTIELEKFFILPKTDPARENVLNPGEVLVEVTIPGPAPGARSVYLEAREKQSFDWPLVSVAVIIASDSSHLVREGRVVMGAVAPIPWRCHEAEAALRGSRLNPGVAARAAEDALKTAAPLSDNGYKVPLAKALMRRAILRAGGIQETG